MVKFSVALLAFALCDASSAARLELGLGQTKFKAREDGTWWQREYDTQNNLLSHSYTVGLSGLFRERAKNTYRAGWRITYADLGAFSGNNRATIHDDEAGKVDGSHCEQRTGRGCLAWYKGSGKARGFSIGATLERNFGPVVLSIEGGPFYFRSSYDVDVFHDQDSLFCPVGNSVQYRHATGSHLTWYAGIRARYGRFYIDFRDHHNIYEQGKGAGGDVGLTGGRTWQATAGISIEF